MGILNKENLDNAFGKIKKATSDFISTVSEDNSAKNKNFSCFCTNCGTGLAANEKFCHNCGTAVAINTKTEIEQPPAIPKESEPEAVQHNETVRKQEYAGRILKCPNCGGVIGETTVVCPECGIKITGKTAMQSIQSFKDELMNLENMRMDGIKSIILGHTQSVDPVDLKKISLIQNFPIPNSIDDIVEFMLLASSNIDVGVSKGKWNKKTYGNETSYTIKRSISNAWISKMMQAYQKAEILFSNESAFIGIQKLYFNKLKELKIKVD